MTSINLTVNGSIIELELVERSVEDETVTYRFETNHPDMFLVSIAVPESNDMINMTI